MANNTEVVFENIDQRILKEIGDAHYAIFVSVAWFTNKKLFNALLDKARNNCYVSIIIQLDEINAQCGIDYSQIQIGRSECFKISKDAELLHDKFCVIDFKKVITGSYNWTYKASHNSENILILNDPSVATQYISRFEQQKAKFEKSSQQEILSSKITSEKRIDSPHTLTNDKSEHIKGEAHNPKLCPYCNKEMEFSPYCPQCGERMQIYFHNGDLYKTRKLRIEVTCKKCSRQQEEAFIDALGTKFCTYCGSDKLEWKCIQL